MPDEVKAVRFRVDIEMEMIDKNDNVYFKFNIGQSAGRRA